MTAVDDLKVGMFVAIIGDYEPNGWHDEMPTMMEMFYGATATVRPKATGQPLKILAISLPFLAVTDGERTYPIDVRECRLQKLSPGYVKAMMESKQQQKAKR